MGVPVPAAREPRLTVAEFVREAQTQERLVLSALRDDALWKNPTRAAELMNVLRAAETLRTSGNRGKARRAGPALVSPPVGPRSVAPVSGHFPTAELNGRIRP